MHSPNTWFLTIWVPTLSARDTTRRLSLVLGPFSVFSASTRADSTSSLCSLYFLSEITLFYIDIKIFGHFFPFGKILNKKVVLSLNVFDFRLYLSCRNSGQCLWLQLLSDMGHRVCHHKGSPVECVLYCLCFLKRKRLNVLMSTFHTILINQHY